MLERSFCDVFKILRIEKNLSQDAIAKELDVSQSLINNWESGRSTPAPEMLEYIADYFDVSVDYLIGRTDDKIYYGDVKNNYGLAPAILNLVKNETLEVQLLCLEISQTIINHFDKNK